ncbi:MAG TPA: hypothetical protein VF704_05100 [Allosphingosinicella sp.]|jgi:hypothetical protein
MLARFVVAAPAALLLAGCNPAVGPEAAANETENVPVANVLPPNMAEPPPPANVAEAPAPEVVAVPQDDPGTAGMSAWQRRAWEAGYRDCSAGRYEPDPWPEAYRIGCGAAEERKRR